MVKIAIVGPEGSGKTVMLAGLGSLYERPDGEGYYLEPINRTTYSYVSGLVHGMRNGHWPAATETDAQRQLSWNLRQRDGESAGEVICRISFLDFAGEVYLDAFGREKGAKQKFKEEGNCLRRNVRQADVVFVLVNLSDVIHGTAGSVRSAEIGWTTKSILDYILNPQRVSSPKTVIVLSQADAYKSTIDAAGGPKQALETYLPIVGNSYADVDVVAVTSVDKVKLDDEGAPVPDANFSFAGLKVLMDVILQETDCIAEAEKPAASGNADDVNGCVFALAVMASTAAVVICLGAGHWGVAIFLGVVSLVVMGSRKGSASTAAPWLACILLIGGACALGATGHWILASIAGVIAIGAIKI